MKERPLTTKTKLLLRTEKCTKSFDFALELSTADLPLVTFGLGLLELGFETSNLVKTLLPIAASSKGVGFALLDLRSRFDRGAAFC